ncbi:molybdopterin molybdotransferase MoeA [Thalassotalea marina]|uniref:Molybdopterin molybdenumtransferase n=1 Tax=Thalassotalea marina TaxID=1673741 RepID=A0A919BJI1_9GAMM|nr:gephyrin-like molybdotransferase Glp [Thalassotalea marina]GHF91953.1 molybdopterin molybdenumtransferase MoeA [Thalassotalea marina]
MIDCCSAPGLMPYAQAKSNLLNKITAVEKQEIIGIEDCAKRVNAAIIVSPINVPAHNNSAMDGYAFNVDFAETPAQPPHSYQLVGTAMAGRPYIGELAPGQCIRIMTGAVVPDSANSVEMQENVSVNDGLVTLNQPLKLNNHIRLAGEDIQKDQQIFLPGHQFSAPDIGLLASLGIDEIAVNRKLRVAVFSTGDELKSAGQVLQTGEIYESNRHVLMAMLNNMNIDVLDLGIIPDDYAQIKQAFEQADQQADAVISSGGVSVGDADYTKDVLEELGQIEFWKIAIKPGKPFAFGTLPNSVFFGLPGNPVSSTVTFHLLAVPALIKMMGTNYTEPLLLPATTTIDIQKRAGRMDFQRGIAQINESGQLVVEPLPAQGSGILSSMSKANCYIVLAQDHQGCVAGSDVSIQMFDHILRC